jgi:hypothetical protein
MRRFAKEGPLAVVALARSPLTVGVLVKRAWRRERLLGQRDIAWLGHGAVVLAGAVLALWLMAAVFIAVASIVVAIPDI